MIFSVIISILSVLVLRQWLSYSNNKQINIQYNDHKIKAILIPQYKYIFKSVGVYCYLGIMYVLGMYAFIISHKFNIFILLMGMIVLFIVTMINYFLYPIDRENIKIKEIK